MHPSLVFLSDALLDPISPSYPKKKAPISLASEGDQLWAEAEDGSTKEGDLGADEGDGAWEKDVFKDDCWGNGRQ